MSESRRWREFVAMLDRDAFHAPDQLLVLRNHSGEIIVPATVEERLTLEVRRSVGIPARPDWCFDYLGPEANQRPFRLSESYQPFWPVPGYLQSLPAWSLPEGAALSTGPPSPIRIRTEDDSAGFFRDMGWNQRLRLRPPLGRDERFYDPGQGGLFRHTSELASCAVMRALRFYRLLTAPWPQKPRPREWTLVFGKTSRTFSWGYGEDEPLRKPCDAVASVGALGDLEPPADCTTPPAREGCAGPGSG